MSRFFIERPIFAWVVAIVIMLAGLLALRTLPISQYPQIAPTTVQISANYPGADAQMKVNLGYADIARSKAVTQMDYGNVLFFHWLWAQSPQKVFDLIAAMPRDPANDTEQAQISALRAFLPQDAPDQYAAAYRGGKIFR